MNVMALLAILNNKDNIKLSTVTITTTTSSVNGEKSLHLDWWSNQTEDATRLGNGHARGISIFKAERWVKFFVDRGDWLDNFKKTQPPLNIQIIKEIGSAASAFSNRPEVVVNVDCTKLFWKRMSKYIYIARTGFKAAKECFIPLLGGNDNGNFKLKLQLVYHSKTPWAMKGILKLSLPIIWKFNKKSWIIRDISQNCFSIYSYPFAKRYEPNVLFYRWCSKPLHQHIPLKDLRSPCITTYYTHHDILV